jgi:hypothetical protein
MSHADIKEYEALVRRLKTLSIAQTVFLKVQQRYCFLLLGSILHAIRYLTYPFFAL